MKKLLTLGLILLLNLGISAQNNAGKFYLLFEFMQVRGEQTSEYLKVEEFWSGIHKQRLADKTILGWDLWALSPSGKEQGSQYLTVTLFPTLQSMLTAIGSLDVWAYAKKAYPNKTDKELTALLDKTVKSRDLANQVLFKAIIMKQLDKSYENVESEIFKPWHQKMVDDGKKGAWKFLKAILPSGSEAYGTHLTVSMYKDEAQLAEFMENSRGTMDLMTQLAVNQGLKTRDLKETKMAKLIMKVE